jgi:hypothetical protein
VVCSRGTKKRPDKFLCIRTFTGASAQQNRAHTKKTAKDAV